MKKPKPKRMAMNRETILNLGALNLEALRQVVGGEFSESCSSPGTCTPACVAYSFFAQCTTGCPRPENLEGGA